jgi:hypothetical protein
MEPEGSLSCAQEPTIGPYRLLIVLIISGEEYKLCSSWLCSFLQTSVSSSHVDKCRFVYEYSYDEFNILRLMLAEFQALLSENTCNCLVQVIKVKRAT